MHKKAYSKNAQGAIEYLLIIGAAILVVALVITAMITVLGTGKSSETTAQSGYTTKLNDLTDLAEVTTSTSTANTISVPTSLLVNHTYPLTVASGVSGTTATLLPQATSGTVVSSPLVTCTRNGSSWTPSGCTSTTIPSGTLLIVNLSNAIAGFTPTTSNFTPTINPSDFSYVTATAYQDATTSDNGINTNGGFILTLKNNSATSIEITDILFNEKSGYTRVFKGGFIWLSTCDDDPACHFPLTFAANETNTINYVKGEYFHSPIGAPDVGQPWTSSFTTEIKVVYTKNGVTYVQALGTKTVPIANSTLAQHYTY